MHRVRGSVRVPRHWLRCLSSGRPRRTSAVTAIPCCALRGQEEASATKIRHICSKTARCRAGCAVFSARIKGSGACFASATPGIQGPSAARALDARQASSSRPTERNHAKNAQLAKFRHVRARTVKTAVPIHSPRLVGARAYRAQQTPSRQC